MLAYKLFVYICVELSTNKNKITMKKTINVYEFTYEMTKHGFTAPGAIALFDYLEQYEEETGDEIEFDPIVFRFEYSEYKNLQEIVYDYGEEYNNIDYLEQHTSVIQFDGGLVIVNF